MAILRDLDADTLRPLPARTLVGRTPACTLRLDDRHVSGEHAVLIWTGSEWHVRDLGSRNGTFVDGTRVAPGASASLVVGAQLGFGRQQGRWELVEAGAPGLVAQRLGGGTFLPAVDGLLALPNADAPEVAVYIDGRGQWVAEWSERANEPLSNGSVLQVGDASWRLHIPDTQEGTATIDAGPAIDTVSLRFAVSRDEEHVQLTVLHRGKQTTLEPREHGYVLLTLARARLEDADQPLAEQGWLDRDRLLRMLGVDGNALNVAIYRARGQLAAAGVERAAAVVEVRRGQRRLGVEPDRLEVCAL